MRTAATLMLLLLAGCIPASDRTLTVFAASSLHLAFTELGERFEQTHPGTSVQFSFAGSAELAEQLRHGAPADVFAAADAMTMDKFRTTGGRAITTSQLFATNRLTIVTAPGNPKRVTGLASLAQPGIVTVVCAPQVPCGSATHQASKAAQVQLHPASEEQSVADVLNKVTSGQADAGLVYVTDAAAAGARVSTVSLAADGAPITSCVIGGLRDSPSTSLAREFIDLVTSPGGQQLLRDKGFGAP